jgi:hypothetical protein
MKKLTTFALISFGALLLETSAVAQVPPFPPGFKMEMT